MFLVAGCSGPLPNTAPLPPARSSPPVSHHLLHLPEIQSGMENPHPLRIYTSSLTSPSRSCSPYTLYMSQERQNPAVVQDKHRRGIDDHADRDLREQARDHWHTGRNTPFHQSH